MEKVIRYLGMKARVGCDEKCNKAWGVNYRPRVYMAIGEDVIFGLDGTSILPDEEPEGFDCDDYAYCSDEELGEAPIETESWEGGDTKPKNDSEKGNKWCVRECERCGFQKEWTFEVELKDFSNRQYNCPPHTR